MKKQICRIIIGFHLFCCPDSSADRLLLHHLVPHPEPADVLPEPVGRPQEPLLLFVFVPGPLPEGDQVRGRGVRRRRWDNDGPDTDPAGGGRPQPFYLGKGQI